MGATYIFGGIPVSIFSGAGFTPLFYFNVRNFPFSGDPFGA